MPTKQTRDLRKIAEKLYADTKAIHEARQRLNNDYLGKIKQSYKYLEPLNNLVCILAVKHFGCEHKPVPSPLIPVFVLLSTLITRSAVLCHQHWALLFKLAELASSG